MQGSGDHFQASLTATPTSKIDSDTTYIGFHFLEKNSTKTVTSVETAFKNNVQAQKKHVAWNGQDWLSIEYPGKNAQNQSVTQWMVFAAKGQDKYLVVAGTPSIEAKQKILSILSTIKIH